MSYKIGGVGKYEIETISTFTELFGRWTKKITEILAF
jgi:hypothetical protein